MENQSRIGLKPEDYMSSDPAQQRVGDTQAGMESLASYEDGGDEKGQNLIGSKGGSTRSGEVSDDFGASGVGQPGTGSPATDNLSNNGNSVR